MAYDLKNFPALITQPGLGLPGLAGSLWLINCNDDISVVASTPGYIQNAGEFRMQPSDRIIIANTTNGRSWLTSLFCVDDDGNGTIGDFGTLSVGQINASEAAGWSNMANGSAGIAVRFPVGNAPTFSASGTFGAGGSVQLEGSNDMITWAALSPPPLTTSGSFKQLQPGERVIFIRPHVTAGDGTTSITVSY